MRKSRHIRILIVEDQDVVRIGLRLSLESSPDIEIVGEAADGVTAVEEAVRLKPDVILMDIGLPNMDGIAAATLIKKELPARIIMFTDHDDDQSVFAALSAGADGYCLKDVPADKLVRAVETVADGAIWLDDRVAGRVLRSYNTGAAAPSPEPTPEPARPDRQKLQQEVLSLMVEGLSAEEIAARLELPAEEVNDCLEEAMEKLSKSERAQAALADLRREMFKDVPGLSKWCPKCQSDLDPRFKVCPFDGASLDQPSEEQLMGQVFADRYEITDLVGRGAMGIVYKARHKFMNRMVAIKILHPYLLSDVENLKRFRLEAEAASALQHPNVIRIFDFGLTTGGEAFLVMEFLDGYGLDEILKRNGALSVDRSVGIFLQCCDALEHAHSKGIVHRDLKPSNVVLVREDGQRDSVRIVDFGIAKFVGREAAVPTAAVKDKVVQGSPAYMSPEQVRSRPLDTRSDIYSFACLMYETLAGRPPFLAHNALEAMDMHVKVTPEPLRNIAPELRVPAELDSIIQRALSKDPANRQQTVAQLRNELLPFRSNKPSLN
jgi:serine/threonine protein kinase/CheY-like chemotaxis protein